MSTFNNIFSLVNANKSNLFLTLPSTIRDSRLRVSWTIVPRFVPVPSFQFQGWTVFTHPEGTHCVHKAWAGITVITEAWVLKPDVLDHLNAWLGIIFNVITEKDIHLPQTSQLFLEISQDLCACNYYFVDHALRTVFWLHTLDIIGIGPPRPFSIGHLRHPLQENYWIHVGIFAETASEYSAAALDELSNLLLHARTDALALGPPAFPYADECKSLIEIAKRSKANRPHATACVARSWETVTNHRCFVRFASERRLVLTIVSKILLFGFPDEHLARFESLCVDQLVYTSRWRKHVSKTIGFLKQDMSRTLAFLSVNISMMQISSFPTLAILSLLLCTLDLTVTFILLQEQRRLIGTKATPSAVYLGGWVTGYGFQPIAIVHGLPKALFVWGLILFTIQHFSMAFPNLSFTFPLSASLLVVAMSKPLGMCGYMNGPSPTPKVVYPMLPVPTPLAVLTPAVVGSRAETASNG